MQSVYTRHIAEDLLMNNFQGNKVHGHSDLTAFNLIKYDFFFSAEAI